MRPQAEFPDNVVTLDARTTVSNRVASSYFDLAELVICEVLEQPLGGESTTRLHTRAAATAIAVVERLESLVAATAVDPSIPHTLIAPLRERVTSYAPADESELSRALTSLVVRNCPLVELTHASLGSSDAGLDFVKSLTTRAVPLVTAAWDTSPAPDADPTPFLSLRSRFPDAWRVLEALAEGLDRQLDTVELENGHGPPRPFLVNPNDTYCTETGRFRADGVDPRIGHDEWLRIGWLSDHPDVPYATTDWTRFGRSCQRMLGVLDGLLSRGITVVLTNAMVNDGRLTIRHPQVRIVDDFEQRVRNAREAPWLKGRDDGSPIPPLGSFVGRQYAMRTLDRGSRNLLCPCGSGQKRKRCCAAVASVSLPIV